MDFASEFSLLIPPFLAFLLLSGSFAFFTGAVPEGYERVPETTRDDNQQEPLQHRQGNSTGLKGLEYFTLTVAAFGVGSSVLLASTKSDKRAVFVESAVGWVR